MEPPESDVEELLLVLLLAVVVATWEHGREEAMAAVLRVCGASESSQILSNLSQRMVSRCAAMHVSPEPQECLGQMHERSCMLHA
eukprot:236692-Chlamydomonas_euryale.AAC.1